LVENALHKGSFSTFATGKNHSGFGQSFGNIGKPLPKFLKFFSRPTNKSGWPIFSVKGYCIWFLLCYSSSDKALGTA